MATRARFAASDSAVARPIPDEAPVTSATFPLKSKELFITEALNQFLTSRELHRWFQGYAFYVAGKRKQNQSTQRGEQPRDHQHRYVRKVIDHPARAENKKHRANARACSTQTSDGGHRFVREEIARQSLDVVDPNLKSEEHDPDQCQREHRIVRKGRKNSGGH